MDKIEYENNLVVSRLKEYIHETAFNLISDIQKVIKNNNIRNTATDRFKLVNYALPIIEHYFLSEYEYRYNVAGVEVICDERINPPDQIENGIINMEARVYAKYQALEIPVQIFLEEFKED